jgi:hypothetical protein
MVDRVRDRVDDVVDAVRGGRAAMEDKELELRVRRDGPAAGAEVVSVEPGRVIVLRTQGTATARRRRA